MQASRSLAPEVRFATRAVHGGRGPDPATGALLTPLCVSTTFAQDAVGVHRGYTYARSGNPTVAALERALGELEGAPPAVAFGSGMAALTALFLTATEPGDRVLVSDVVYGGTTRLLRTVLEPRGLEVAFVDTSDEAALRRAVERPAALLLVETPANPTLKVTDLSVAAAAARDAGALLAVDNTFLTPALQRPLELGASVSVYSTTKFVEGHNATLGGALVARDEALLERAHEVRKTVGSPQSPFEAWLTLRGLETLELRMQRHTESARAVARFLGEQPAVRRVHYPGVGGVLSFELAAGGDAARAFLAALRLGTIAESLGAPQTMATHPASMSHSCLPPEERRELGIGDDLVRLSVGLEDPADLLDEFRRVLTAGGAA